MDEIQCEGYNLELVPQTAADDKKTCVTIKGSESGYLEAHKLLKEMTKKKGDRFLINGIEIGISDTPKNKPINVEVKPRAGMSGKVNLTIFDVNNRGGATIMVSKIRGGDPRHARILGIEVVKYFLDGVIEGTIKENDVAKYKMKNPKVLERQTKIVCEQCEKGFVTEQGLKTHIRRVHTNREERYCELCRITFKNEKDFKVHMEFEHEEIFSPEAKKRKRDTEEEEGLQEEIVDMSKQESLKQLEEKSFEELRMKHREIEIQVNEEELLNMKEYNDEKRMTEVKTKVDDIETKNDEKVLEKQKSWFEAEVKYQEMKRKFSEEKIRDENKRKRQLSIAKKKKSKSRKQTKSKNIIDEYEEDVIIDADVEQEKEDEESYGYMGWKSKNDDKDAIRNAFDEIRIEVQEIKAGGLKQSKIIKKLEKDVQGLKEEYRQCLETLSKETYERNKAEDMVKILQETMEAERKQKEIKDSIVNSEDEMLVDQSELETHIVNEHWQLSKFKCENCKLCFKTKCHLENHVKEYHKTKIVFECEDCKISYKTESYLEKHTRSLHVGRKAEVEESVELQFKCEKCERSFRDEEQLKVHSINAHADKVFTCQICDKPYTSMSLLRRHDWRSHREIDCNLCGETIESRQDIKKHRETKHQMFKKVFCKYYPECIDGDECFFEHERESNVYEAYEALNCPDGEKCKNQSCNFSEQKHTSISICKFQANCNRLNCQFKHNVPRKAFLEEGLIRRSKI